MPDWIVITSDRASAGRGVRGYTLAWFLRTYFGRRAVALRTPDQHRSHPLSAQTVLLGLPSSLEPDEIRRLADDTGCQRLAPFDYLDQHELAWNAEQEAVIRERTDLYFKPWFEPAWRHNLRMRLLPLRLRRRLANAVRWDRATRALVGRPRPKYDVSFLGRPNLTKFFVDGEVRDLDQRVNWLRELRCNAPDLRVYGGLTDRSHPLMRPEVLDLAMPGDKVNFFAYWRAMRRSRVLLAPGGNVPWTYRHYECLYAGGVVVTVDYRERQMLIPLPVDHMVHVPDGASVLPAVREALEAGRRRPTLGDETFTHLEQYLKRGGYSRTRPKLIERFLAQFP